MRLPVVAGQFYSDSGLDNQIKECFTHPYGPGALPSGKRSGILKAAICPHAGFIFSGPCAAHSYKVVAESNLPDVFLMLGLSHSGKDSCFSLEDWQIPTGVLKNDKEFTAMLSKETGLPINERAHAQEHSIEVQLPFLKFAAKNPKICPLIVSHDVDPLDLGKQLKNIIAKQKKSVCIIASSDFTHYGINYGYIPFASDQKENLYKLDRIAIDLILANKPGKFLDYIDEKGATICGSLPIACLLAAIGFEESDLLKYYTSGDIINDYSSAVGYASIVFR